MQANSVTIFYTLSFLGGFFFNLVAPLFIVYGLSLGFTIAQVGLLLGVMKLSTFVFEVPTGILADSYGRKKSVLFAYFLGALFALIYFFSSSFYFLLFGSLIGGLAATFMTGAFEALAVDSLGLADKEHWRNKFFIRSGIAATLGFIMGGIVSSAIAYINLRYIWPAQAITAIFALLIGWRFIDERYFALRKAMLNQKEKLKISIHSIKKFSLSFLKEKKIPFIFCIIILVAFAEALYLVGWPLIFKDILLIPIHYFSLISAVAASFFLFGSLTAERLSYKKGTINTLVLSLMLGAVFYLVFGLSKSIILSLVSFILIDFFSGGFSPLFYSWLNKFIPSSKRATFLSFVNLTSLGSTGIGEIVAGSLLLVIAAPLVVLLSPVLLLVALVLLLWMKKRGAVS